MTRKVRKSSEWRAKRRRLLVCVSTSSITWLSKSYLVCNIQRSSDCVLGAMKHKRRRSKFVGNVKEGVQLQTHCKSLLILSNRHGGSRELDECRGAGSGELSHDFAARKSSQLDGEQFCMLQFRIRRVLLRTQSMRGDAKQMSVHPLEAPPDLFHSHCTKLDFGASATQTTIIQYCNCWRCYSSSCTSVPEIS